MMYVHCSTLVWTGLTFVSTYRARTVGHPRSLKIKANVLQVYHSEVVNAFNNVGGKTTFCKSKIASVTPCLTP
jgi:hypothetical protein